MSSRTNMSLSGRGYLGDVKDTREFETNNGTKMFVKRFLLKVLKPSWERKKLLDDENPYVFADFEVVGPKDSKFWLQVKPGASIMYKEGELRAWERNDGGYGLAISCSLRDVMCDDRFSNRNKQNNEGMEVSVSDQNGDLPPF